LGTTATAVRVQPGRFYIPSAATTGGVYSPSRFTLESFTNNSAVGIDVGIMANITRTTAASGNKRFLRHAEFGRRSVNTQVVQVLEDTIMSVFGGVEG
jgi:hypothetical protein